MQQKTEVKKRTNKTIVLETQSDEMFRSGTRQLEQSPSMFFHFKLLGIIFFV
jgi:hypothetical protein